MNDKYYTKYKYRKKDWYDRQHPVINHCNGKKNKRFDVYIDREDMIKWAIYLLIIKKIWEYR